MTIRKYPGLTALESEILSHRLEVCDCIAECLMESHPEYTDEALAEIINLIDAGRWDEAFSVNRKMAADVLWDAVDGSTYYGAAKGSVSTQQLSAIGRAGRSLAAKVSALIDRPVRYPER